MTIREFHANHHVIVLIMNTRDWQRNMLLDGGYQWIAVVTPRRLGCLIDTEWPFSDHAMLAVKVRVECRRTKCKERS